MLDSMYRGWLCKYTYTEPTITLRKCEGNVQGNIHVDKIDLLIYFLLALTKKVSSKLETSLVAPSNKCIISENTHFSGFFFNSKFSSTITMTNAARIAAKKLGCAIIFSLNVVVDIRPVYLKSSYLTNAMFKLVLFD